MAFSPPSLLAWSYPKTNEINVIELETKQNYASFEGVRIKPGTSMNFIFFNANLTFLILSKLDSCKRNSKYEIACLAQSMPL